MSYYLAGYIVDHFLRMGKLVVVPSEILLSIGVFNIEPDDVHWDIVLVEFGINLRKK